jgi:NADH-quinone oxidoreductase subunit J
VGAEAFLFWFLAIVTLASGLAVVLVKNPIYSALSLAMTMVGVSALFVTLGAYFIAGVQLIVYAGAVMVLFVMVIMLFDLKTETQAFARGVLSGVLKIGTVGLMLGMVVTSIVAAGGLMADTVPTAQAAANLPADPSKALGILLFTKHVFGFEALGVLLLVIAIGTVALARSKGGTHADH